MPSLAKAVTKAVTASFRRWGAVSTAPNWPIRAAMCETCHLRVIRCGVSYCGRPYTEHPFRDESTEGCGCPCVDKAKDPGEHCPLDYHALPAHRDDGRCTCKWCASHSCSAP